MKKVKIKVNRSVAGNWNGDGFAFGAGSIQEVDEELAKDLCRGNVNASLVLEKESKKTATAKTPEKITR